MGNTFKGGMDRPHKKATIRVGGSVKNRPAICLPCFEQRHDEHQDQVTFSPDKCECNVCTKRHSTEPLDIDDDDAADFDRHWHDND